MRFTLAFVTGRREPHLEWVVESLAPQLAEDDRVDLIVVDALFHARAAAAAAGEDMPLAHVHKDTAKVWEKFDLMIVPPKPTIWQGRSRVTRQNWWAMSSSRNSALVLCDTEWIAFLDDRCLLGRDWMKAFRAAVDGYYVVCGGYEKRTGIFDEPQITTDYVVRCIASSEPPPGGCVPGVRTAIDNRFEATLGQPHRNATGNYLYGCSFAMPLQMALEVNGFEEGCDSLSAEDYIFGMMLANAGFRIDYDPAMWVIQDRSPAADPGSAAFRREDKGVSPNDKSHAALSRFGTRKRTEFTPDLVDMRVYVREHGKFPELAVPEGGWRDWYDDEPIDLEYMRSKP